MIGEEIRRRRQEQGLTGVQLAAKAGMAPSAVSQIETGRRTPHSASVVKLAGALECEVADLYPKGPRQLSLEDRPTLEDLHAAAGCETDWLIMPEAEWQASWPLRLTPHEAMQIVREMAAEFAALKPLMAAEEEDLSILKSAINGRYRQAWTRFFAGMRAAHECGVANGLITPEDTLNDLEEKLGEKPSRSFEGLLLAS